MRAADYLGYTWRNVTRAQLRLILTVLAVIIGATLVVVMTSIGGGIQRNVLEDIRASGGLNEIGVSSLGAAQVGPATVARSGVLNQDTLDTIQSINGVTAVLPEVVNPALLFSAVVQSQDRTARALLVGVAPERMASYGFAAAQGSAAPQPGQVVLGARVSETFFDANNQRVPPLELFGEPITLRARRINAQSAPPAGLPSFGAPSQPPAFQDQDKELTVAGILQALGTQDDFTIWLNQDDVLDALEWITRRRPDLATEGYQAVRVKTASIDLVRPVQRQITDLGLQATSPLSVLDQVNQQMLVLQLLLATIGLIALIVSGLGVANTMLMATFERTREIGILKALGATEGQIARLFLLEASLIGLLGAALGLLLGWLATQVVNAALLQLLAQQVPGAAGPPRAVLYTPGWVPPAVVVSAWLIAVLAGLYPSLRAARLNIASALRAE